MHGVDHHASPEAAAVLPAAPSLGGVVAAFGGCFQYLFGEAASAVFLSVEAGEMLANDLPGGVAFYPFSAGVPAHHSAFGIEHVNGVIHHSSDEEAGNRSGATI